jgi:hypothetical protein
MLTKYNEADFLILDIFKGLSLFKSLETYNSVINKVSKQASYKKGCFYQTTNQEASFWFDVDQIRKTPLPKDYPNLDPIQMDPRFNLQMHIANYMSLLVLDACFGNRRDVLIEDMCCGMGNLVFYLNKLGFNNFSMIDNFSQLPKKLFDSLMEEARKTDPTFKYRLNDYSCSPIAINIIAYTRYLRRDSDENPIFPESLELFLSYVPLVPNTAHLQFNNNQFFQKYRWLATDPHRMIWAYCTDEKYADFYSRLERYKI